MMPAGHDGIRTRALLLVGHGSHLNASSSTPVYEHAQRLRATGWFDEVVEAFWKEEPSLRDAISLIESDDVFIVPLFLAEGYFTRQVVPREIWLRELAPNGDDRRHVHYCPPVGGHPAMGDLVREQALAISRLGGFDPASAALVIIGHGTERSSTSGGTVHHLVRSLRARGDFVSVTCGFLDESPGIAEVLESADAPNVVLVPYFLAEGWHTAATIPRDLSLEGVRTVRGGRSLWYAPPIGTLPEIAGIVLSIVAETDKASRDPSSRVIPASECPRVDRPVAVARRHFFEWLDGAGKDGATFLRVRIRRTDRGRYRVTHDADSETPDHLLVRSNDPESALRTARVDEAGRYRPLRSADTLARGWLLDDLDAAGLWRAISLLYPGAVLRWAERRFGVPGPPTVPFTAWAARQSGMYESVGSIGRPDLLETVSDCCGSCLRRRHWSVDAEAPIRVRPPADGPRAGPPMDGMEVVPCLEPCTVFGSLALSRVSPREARPPPDPRLAAQPA